MARTAVPYSNLVPNGQLADPAGTAVASGAGNGGQIASSFPELTVLRVANASGGSGTISVLPGSLPLAAAGGQGAFTATVANSTSSWLGPFESGRFIQNDGSIVFETSVA